MTHNSPAAQPTIALDDPAELDRFLTAYRPTDVAESVWLTIADEAADLVKRAGNLTRLRVEKDIQCLGAVVTHLVERGRPISLPEVLSDASLASYDSALGSAGASRRTRENKRGILRRLQACHHGLPWRTARRADGERVQSIVPPTIVADLARALTQANATVSTDQERDASAFVTVVAHARAERAGAESEAVAPSTGDWERARRYAATVGIDLTKRLLRAAVTHEVLDETAPAAVLARRYSLTRRDLDLALTRLPDLPAVPNSGDMALLRGAAQGPARV